VADLRIELFHLGKINRVMERHRALLEHPVRQPAVATSPWPRTDARNRATFPCLAHSSANLLKVSLAAPIELAFNLFVMNPET